ncbi:uncharacterized protein E5676_scaffold455G002340 [Cucumis melo var. makuwa]|uniref:Uncharacterized protein n=1 Tax=Cucumis melo var. makuwa TaxID=1194695 RepID=A0A5D3E531_CUCMM|nr:uncharacterized protein E5676_scaffold455G002340 [Cucumis melo var. makuwa]
MPVEITVSRRGVDFIVTGSPINVICVGHLGNLVESVLRLLRPESKVHQEEDVSKVVSSKGDDLASVVKCKAMFGFLGLSSIGFCCFLETKVREGNFGSASSRFSDSWGYSCSYSNSGVDSIWVFCVYASNSNIEKQLLWHRLVEITSSWSGSSFIMGDFNAIRLLSEALGRSFALGDMEEFDIAICDVDLVEPSVLVCLMRNLHDLKPTLCRHFGRHIRRLIEEMHIAKESMDRAQRQVELNPIFDSLSRQAGLATEAF